MKTNKNDLKNTPLVQLAMRKNAAKAASDAPATATTATTDTLSNQSLSPKKSAALGVSPTAPKSAKTEPAAAAKPPECGTTDELEALEFKLDPDAFFKSYEVDNVAGFYCPN